MATLVRRSRPGGHERGTAPADGGDAGGRAPPDRRHGGAPRATHGRGRPGGAGAGSRAAGARRGRGRAIPFLAPPGRGLARGPPAGGLDPDAGFRRSDPLGAVRVLRAGPVGRAGPSVAAGAGGPGFGPDPVRRDCAAVAGRACGAPVGETGIPAIVGRGLPPPDPLAARPGRAADEPRRGLARVAGTPSRGRTRRGGHLGEPRGSAAGAGGGGGARGGGPRPEPAPRRGRVGGRRVARAAAGPLAAELVAGVGGRAFPPFRVERALRARGGRAARHPGGGPRGGRPPDAGGSRHRPFPRRGAAAGPRGDLLELLPRTASVVGRTSRRPRAHLAGVSRFPGGAAVARRWWERVGQGVLRVLGL